MPHWEKIIFAIGAAVFVFLGGTAVGKFELPPHDQLARLATAATALYREWAPAELVDGKIVHVREGLRSRTDGASPDARLVTALEPDGMRAVLLDDEGKRLHEWRSAFSDVFGADAPHVSRQAADERIHWHGGHVFPDGDFLFNFEGGNFPYGGGLVRVDRNSAVKWKLERNTHHDFTVLDDGRIVTPAHVFRWEGIPACARWLEPPYYEDQVLIVSPEGEVEETISVLEAVCASEFRSILMPRGTARSEGEMSGQDPLHLNDAELVTPELARNFPMAEAGDVFVSLRNLNALAFIDRDTREVRWQIVGPFARQHDPDLLPNGHIMLFDNLGGSPDRGGSRIVELDPVTQGVVWTYEGTKEAPFGSSRAGNQTLMPNGNVLIAETRGGRALEVTRTRRPRIVWEYISARDVDGGGKRANALMRVDHVGPERLHFLERVEVAG